MKDRKKAEIRTQRPTPVSASSKKAPTRKTSPQQQPGPDHPSPAAPVRPMPALMDINLQWLQALEEVERTGSMEAAGERLGVLGGTVSNWLRSLDKSLGFTTTASNPRTGQTTLTTHAQLLRSSIRNLLETSRTFFKQVDPKSLSIGITRAYGGCLAEVLNRLDSSSELPAISYTVECNTSEELLRRVRQGFLDAAIVMEEVYTRAVKGGLKKVRSFDGFSQETLLYAATDHPEFRKLKRSPRRLGAAGAPGLERLRLLTSGEFADIIRSPAVEWLWFDRDSLADLFGDIMSVFRIRYHTAFKIQHDLRDQEALYAMLVSQEAAALLPASVRYFGLPGIKALRCPDELPKWKFCVVAHEDNRLPVHQQLCERLVSIGREMP